jgi:3-phenylpropionate/cinnamic acid dioxygenase small subunit
MLKNLAESADEQQLPMKVRILLHVIKMLDPQAFREYLEIYTRQTRYTFYRAVMRAVNNTNPHEAGDLVRLQEALAQSLYARTTVLLPESLMYRPKGS